MAAAAPVVADIPFLNKIQADTRATLRALTADNKRISTAVILKDQTLLQVFPGKFGQAKPTFASFQAWKKAVEQASGSTVERFYYQGSWPTGPYLHFTLPEGVDSDRTAATAIKNTEISQSVLQMLQENVQLAEENVQKRKATEKAAYEAYEAAIKKGNEAKIAMHSANTHKIVERNNYARTAKARASAERHLAKVKAEYEAAKARSTTA